MNPERGGFSQRRLDEAAGQVSRLRTAFWMGRRFFHHLSSDFRSAVLQLSEQLSAAPASDDAWVNVHADLPDTEAAALANRAFALLGEPFECSELCLEILASLANFRRDGLGAQTSEVLKREIFELPNLYRDAPDTVAHRLIEHLREDENPHLIFLLLAFAWTRGEPARRAFLARRNSPPQWVDCLNAPPEDYLHAAGWTLDSSGQRRNLISACCYRIRPFPTRSTGHFCVPCRTEIQERCPGCGGSLAWLFDFTNLPDEFFSSDRASAPRRILSCLDCACFSPVFSRYQPDGTAELHPANQFQNSDNFGGRPAAQRELIPEPHPPFAASQPFDVDDATSLGGVPMWLQDVEFPSCPDCQQVMQFLAQFDAGSMTPPEEGVYYSFFCPDCRTCAVSYQQT